MASKPDNLIILSSSLLFIPEGPSILLNATIAISNNPYP